MLVGMRPSIFTPVFLLLLSDQVPVAGQLQNATVDPDDGAENSTLNVPQPLYRHLKADKDAVLGCPASGDRHTVPNPDCNLIGPFPKGQRFFSEHISPTYFNYVCPAGQIFCMEMNGRGLVDAAHASNFTAETSLVYTVSAELEELQGQLWNGSMRTCRGLDADALRPRHATLRVYERYTRSSAATTNVIYSQLITIVCLYVSISLRSLAL
ncbi:unnamed protein product, partial [Mesorhabditis spiculigera]